jgi:hypothetical protein
MTELRAIVSAEAAVAEELPLVHTTRCEILPHIVASHELRSVTPCDVFQEHLIYFFYGRPAYRHALGSEPSGNLDLCPVCFVFKPHTIGSKAKRVFACDSGGVHKGYFEDHLFPPDRDEMQLDTTLDSARKLVPLVFGDNSRYYTGEAKSALPAAFAPGTPAARFHALLTDTAAGAGDDRRSAIEVQMDSPVTLDHHLLYVILPMDKLNEPGIREVILQNWQTDPIGYKVTKFRQPHEYRTLIGDLLEERYKQGGRL